MRKKSENRVETKMNRSSIKETPLIIDKDIFKGHF
jgi:hypothetical protein